MQSSIGSPDDLVPGLLNSFAACEDVADEVLMWIARAGSGTCIQEGERVSTMLCQGEGGSLWPLRWRACGAARTQLDPTHGMSLNAKASH